MTFDEIITRAFTNLPDMVQLTHHLLGKNGVLLAMKGKAPAQEMAQLPVKPTVIPIQVPGIDGERCLIKIKSLEQAEVR
jgi:16S rRNA (guanine527-N7)-methyltransferase